MPKDDGFLKEFFVDCQNRMQWRSETEYRLLHMLIILNPVIITVVLGMNELVKNELIFLVLTCSLAAFLTVLTVLLTSKVQAEHKMYEKMGQQIVKIWEYFKLFEKGSYIDNDSILDDEAKEYGKGKGHLRTLNIIWAMTIMTDIMLIAIGVIRYTA